MTTKTMKQTAKNLPAILPVATILKLIEIRQDHSDFIKQVIELYGDDEKSSMLIADFANKRVKQAQKLVPTFKHFDYKRSDKSQLVFTIYCNDGHLQFRVAHVAGQITKINYSEWPDIKGFELTKVDLETGDETTTKFDITNSKKVVK
jgi:hypothetical protein